MKPRLFPTELKRSPADKAAPAIEQSVEAAIEAIGDVEQLFSTTAQFPVRPPLPQRPSGKPVLLAVLVLALSGLSICIWNSFLRFKTYGAVTGQVVHVPPPWNGTVARIFVKEGDEVEAGQVLATLENHGLRDKVDELTEKLRVARSKRRTIVLEDDSETERLPVELIESDLRRLQEQIQRRTIRAPFSGRIVDVSHEVAEYVEPSDSIVAMLRRGSTEILIFSRQYQSDQFRIGDAIDVVIAPRDETIRCRVVRVGEEYQKAPENLAKHFRHDEKLLPVYLKPVTSQLDRRRLTLGSVVQVPNRWLQERE